MGRMIEHVELILVVLFFLSIPDMTFGQAGNNYSFTPDQLLDPPDEQTLEDPPKNQNLDPLKIREIEDPFLWVYRPNNPVESPPIFLFGTIHIGQYRLPEIVRKSMALSGQIFTETNRAPKDRLDPSQINKKSNLKPPIITSEMTRKKALPKRFQTETNPA